MCGDLFGELEFVLLSPPITVLVLYLEMIKHDQYTLIFWCSFLQYMKVKDEFNQRVFAVAMTDSVHYMPDPHPFKDLVKVSLHVPISHCLWSGELTICS